MSRFLKIMIVLLTIAAVAAPVMAEDRLGLSGQMRVRGWYIDNDSDNTTSYMDQRLRIGGKFSIADGVSVTFRTDVTERAWGNGGSEYGSGRMPQDGQQWDRAHLDLDLGNVHVRAGQQYVGYGLAQTVNSQDAGIKVDVKGPVALSAFWLLDDRDVNGFAGDDSIDSDSYLFGANVGHKNDNYAGNIFVAGQTKALSVDEEVYLIGADLVYNLEVVKLMAELNFFTGDATDMVDAIGTQFFLDAALSASEMMTVGGQLYYAIAADTDEVQYTFLGNDFNGYDPLFDLGTSLSNEEIDLQRPFDFTGDFAGAMGARVYVNVKASDAVDFGASIAYLEPEDDEMTDVNSATFIAVAMKYAVMSNTSLQAQLQYTDADVDAGSTRSDSITQGGVGLFVNF